MDASTPKDFERDKLSRFGFSQKLQDYLLIDHQFTDGGLVVSLDGGFGTGKTYFLKMWADHLTSMRQLDGSLPIPVIVNAWEADYCGDPLTAILSEIIGALDRLDLNKKAENEAFKEGLRDCFWFGIGLLNSVTSKVGPNAVAAGDLAKSKKAERSKRPDFIELYESKKTTFEALKTRLRERFESGSAQVIIMIDELDRCRPDYAIHYLEVIKHIFDVHGLIFVLAIDSEQMESSTKALFGNGLNFEEYFRKFAQRRFRLPRPNVESMQQLVDHFTNRILQTETSRSSQIQVGKRREDIANLCVSANMTPRQVQDMFRMLGHVTSCAPEMRGAMFWGIQLGAILMCVLKVKEPGQYERIAAGNADHDFMIKFLSNVGGNNRILWWLKVYLAGLQANKRRFDCSVVVAKYYPPQSSISQSDYEQFFEAWGDVDRNESGFARIHRIIESVSRFGENW